MSLLVEEQGLREVRKYLDYGKRVKEGASLDDFYQWITKILLDDGQIYAQQEQALAFEIGVCELLADEWGALQEVSAADLILSLPLNRCAIYRLALQASSPIAHRAALLQVLEKRYKKHYRWVEELASRRGGGFKTTIGGRLFCQLMMSLDETAPLAGSEANEESIRLRRDGQLQRDKMKQLQKDLEHAEDRAGRAHKRLKEQDQEVQRLRKKLREEKENGEKLRSERKTRIKSQRRSGQVEKDLDNLRREYLKLDDRLKEMARRLAVSEGKDQADHERINLEYLRRLHPERFLGLAEDVDDDELGRIRRRFAAVFHPDRVGELPQWVSDLFLEVSGLVNEACDRAKKR